MLWEHLSHPQGENTPACYLFATLLVIDSSETSKRTAINPSCSRLLVLATEAYPRSRVGRTSRGLGMSMCWYVMMGKPDSETSSPRFYSVVHEYSVHVTSGSKSKLREYRSRRLWGDNTLEGERQDAAVAALPIEGARFYAER